MLLIEVIWGFACGVAFIVAMMGVVWLCKVVFNYE